MNYAEEFIKKQADMIREFGMDVVEGALKSMVAKQPRNVDDVVYNCFAEYVLGRWETPPRTTAELRTDLEYIERGLLG